ncbi:hypothetical protein Tco_1404392 [Tanacetum coccineum]
MLKSLNSKPGDLATKFISVDGQPMRARRSVTYSQPLRDESVKPNVEQPSQHDDCDPMKNAGLQQSQSYVDVVNSESPKKKVNFRTLVNDECVEETDFVLPLDTIAKVKHRFANSLVGFFVGKSVAFQLVKNYVMNTWAKFGFQKVMRDDDGFFYFKFASLTGLEQDEVTRVPVWVKMHKVPVVAYSEDGLSLIATQIGKPIMLDAFTSSMCVDSWGRIGFARALIECPKRVIEQVTVTKDTNDDGFTTMTNKKKKGRKRKRTKPSTETPLNVETKNPFDTLWDQDDVPREAEVGELSGGKNDDYMFEVHDPINEDVDSEVEEVNIESVSSGDVHKGASTPWNTVVNVYVCAILESHVELSVLANICSSVFRTWDWTSNASFCPKGCRIILGGNMDIVSVMGISQSRNVPSVRRHLWAELEVLKRVVRNMPWTLMGDFNVALNMEDVYAGSSTMNSAMCEFKDCVASIEVLDINCSGLHYTWNQKSKGGNGVLKKISDHSPAVLKFPNLATNKPKPFKFFNFLAHKSKFIEVVETHWNTNVAACHSIHKLDEVQKALDLKPADLSLRDEEAIYVQAFTNAKLDEERFLKQKAKVEWLEAVTGTSVPDVFVNHYERFLGSHLACDELDVTDLFFKQVLKASNHNMVQDIPNEEIRVPMFDIGNDRAPDLDGYTSTFFKKGWDIVGFDVDIHGFFKGKRGLRKGDPLSLYLFMLVMEVLTLILKRRVRLSDTFRYHKHCEDLQVINVCFADDLFIFSRGDVDFAKVIMDSLKEFKRTSGLVPNIPKSTTFFCNVLNHVKLAILNIMPFSEGELPVKYLGVPLISSRLLNKDCKILVEKAKNRIGDWKNKSLSFAGRLQLFHLGNGKNTSVWWRDNNGNMTDFSVKCAWEALRPRGIIVAWHRVVWFSRIPRHAFHLWLVMRRSLKTQDKMRQWDVGGGTDLNLLRCSLCDSQPDSHEHLFFECAFSSHESSVSCRYGDESSDAVFFLVLAGEMEL